MIQNHCSISRLHDLHSVKSEPIWVATLLIFQVVINWANDPFLLWRRNFTECQRDCEWKKEYFLAFVKNLNANLWYYCHNFTAQLTRTQVFRKLLLNGDFYDSEIGWINEHVKSCRAILWSGLIHCMCVGMVKCTYNVKNILTMIFKISFVIFCKMHVAHYAWNW